MLAIGWDTTLGARLVVWSFLEAAFRLPELHLVCRLGVTLDENCLRAVAAASHIYHSLREAKFESKNI